MANLNPRILVIEEEGPRATMFGTRIEEALPAASVVRVASVPDLDLLAAKEQPDAIVIAPCAGEASGGLCCRLKGHPSFEGVPVMLITDACMSHDERLEAKRCGVDMLLPAGTDPVDLGLSVQALLAIRKAHNARVREREDLQDELGLAEDKYRNMVNDLPALICEFDPDGTLTFVNHSYVQHFMKPRSELIGRSFFELFPLDACEDQREARIRDLTPLRPASEHTVRMQIRGETRWVQWRNRALFDDRGRLASIYSIGTDITRDKELEEELSRLSYRDHLTGLHNRWHYEQEKARLEAAESLPLALFLADVNGLKLVNDSFGHAAGDRLLCQAADTLLSACDDGDEVARIGGDEFCVLVEDCEEACARARLARMKEAFAEGGRQTDALSVSLGFSVRTDRFQTLDEVFARAENEMYKAKASERASVRSQTIDMIMKSLFEKSERESMHSRRVSELSERLARSLGWPDERIKAVATAALVHDIGKIGIEESILNKEGALTQQEWKRIRKHPEAGWRILSSVRDFHDIAGFVLNHHEHWDGSGYPRGIRGQEIPEESRIIALADAYDVMTSKRSYHDSLTRQEARDELLRCRGGQFDPSLVDRFIRDILRFDDPSWRKSCPCL